MGTDSGEPCRERGWARPGPRRPGPVLLLSHRRALTFPSLRELQRGGRRQTLGPWWRQAPTPMSSRPHSFWNPDTPPLVDQNRQPPLTSAGDLRDRVGCGTQQAEPRARTRSLRGPPAQSCPQHRGQAGKRSSGHRPRGSAGPAHTSPHRSSQRHLYDHDTNAETSQVTSAGSPVTPKYPQAPRRVPRGSGRACCLLSGQRGNEIPTSGPAR